MQNQGGAYIFPHFGLKIQPTSLYEKFFLFFIKAREILK